MAPHLGSLRGQAKTRQHGAQAWTRLIPNVVTVEGRRLLALERLSKSSHDAQFVSSVERGTCCKPEPESTAQWIGTFCATRHRACRNGSGSNEFNGERRRTVQARDLEAQCRVGAREVFQKSVDRLRPKRVGHIFQSGFNRLERCLWCHPLEELDELIREKPVPAQERLKCSSSLSATRREGASQVEGRLGEPECGLAFEVAKIVTAPKPCDTFRLKRAFAFADVVELEPRQDELEAAPLRCMC